VSLRHFLTNINDNNNEMKIIFSTSLMSRGGEPKKFCWLFKYRNKKLVLVKERSRVKENINKVIKNASQRKLQNPIRV